MSNWRPFTFNADGSVTFAHPPTLGEWIRITPEPRKERRQRLLNAGCDVDRLQSARARAALLRGQTADLANTTAPRPQDVLITLAGDLLACGVPRERIAPVIRASAVAHLASGHQERLDNAVSRAAKERERKQHAARWLDPPTGGELLLMAAVALTRERGTWLATPVRQALDELTAWAQRERYPVPPDFPRSSMQLAFALQRIKRRLLIAGVSWRRGRLCGNGSRTPRDSWAYARPTFYEFSSWGKRGAAVLDTKEIA